MSKGITIVAGDHLMDVGGNSYPLDVPIRVEQSDAGVQCAVGQLRPILEALGCQVDWLEPLKLLRVVDKPAPLPMTWPTSIRQITTRFGEVNTALWLDYHQGIDVATPEGTGIWAPCDCLVSDSVEPGAGPLAGYGRHIVLFAWPYWMVFAHLSESSLTGLPAGTQVRKWTHIGKTGSTGLSTGPHLHFGVYDYRFGPLIDPVTGRFNPKAAVDPLKLLQAA